MAKIEKHDELMNILRSAKNPLTTREIMLKIKERCPDISINTLVTLMERCVINGEWVAGKGYVWTLPASI